MTATLSNQHRLGHYSLRAFFAPRALATDPKARSVYSRRRPYQRLAAGYAAGSRTAGPVPTSAGTCTRLAAYAMTPNPRVLAGWALRHLYQSLSDTGTKANSRAHMLLTQAHN